jgi:hypothetical protein
MTETSSAVTAPVPAVPWFGASSGNTSMAEHLAKSHTTRGANGGQPEDLASLPFVTNSALRDPLHRQLTKTDFERQSVRMNQIQLQQFSQRPSPARGLAVLPIFWSLMRATPAGYCTYFRRKRSRWAASTPFTRPRASALDRSFSIAVIDLIRL